MAHRLHPKLRQDIESGIKRRSSCYILTWERIRTFLPPSILSFDAAVGKAGIE